MGFDEAAGNVRLPFAVAARNRDYAIVPIIPAIPLWIPELALKAINTLAMNTLRLALQIVSDAVAGEAQTFSDTGALAQSWGNDPATVTGGMEILGADLLQGVEGRVFSSLPYAIVMEEGRRPGAPISRDGIDAIGLWAQRKLGLSADEAAGAKWAIAQHIINQGIEGKNYVRDGFNAARPRVEQLFAALDAALQQALTGAR